MAYVDVAIVVALLLLHNGIGNGALVGGEAYGAHIAVLLKEILAGFTLIELATLALAAVKIQDCFLVLFVVKLVVILHLLLSQEIDFHSIGSDKGQHLVILARHAAYQFRLKGHRMGIDLVEELRPMQIVGSFAVNFIVLLVILPTSHVEIAREMLHGIGVMLVAVVDYPFPIVRQSVGIVGAKGYQLGEIASDGTGVLVLLGSYHAKIEIGVGSFGITRRHLAQRSSGLAIFLLVIEDYRLVVQLAVAVAEEIGARVVDVANALRGRFLLLRLQSRSEQREK